MLTIGTSAPGFDLPDQNGVRHSLADYAGKWLLIYFYPKDMTPGCTQEACAMEENLPRFENFGTAVVGVSTDTIESHTKFAAAHSLSFPLLADVERTMVAAYGVWGKKKFMGREYEGTKRTSFLVDPRGTIVRIYEEVKPATHPAEVLADIKALQK